jgi:succinate dehydrogenase/fumarate reductase flavoprotein subunit
VLLATGGFQGDRRAVRRFLGPGADLMPVRANPHSTGDGLRMGRAVGASLAGPMDGFHGHLVPSPLERFGPPEFVALSQYHSRHCVLVNQEGRRFTCEKWGDEVSNLALLRQPGMRAILLCDERVRREHVGDAFDLARRAGAHLIRADTLERLADFAERDLLESRLHETPFWALEVQPTITFTYGGLRTDADGRVRDEYGRPNPGALRCRGRRGRPARHRLCRRTRARVRVRPSRRRRRPAPAAGSAGRRAMDCRKERYACQILTC